MLSCPSRVRIWPTILSKYALVIGSRRNGNDWKSCGLSRVTVGVRVVAKDRAHQVMQRRFDLPFQASQSSTGRREKCEPRTHLVAIFQRVFPLESGSTASQVFLVVIFIFFCQLLRRFFQFTEELKENVSVTYSLTHLSKPLVIPDKGLCTTHRYASHLPAEVSHSNYR